MGDAGTFFKELRYALDGAAIARMLGRSVLQAADKGLHHSTDEWKGTTQVGA